MLRRHFLYCVPLLPTAMMPQRSPSFAAGTHGRYLDFGPGTPKKVTLASKFSPEQMREFQASIDEAVRKLNAFLKSAEKTGATLERLPRVFQARRDSHPPRSSRSTRNRPLLNISGTDTRAFRAKT
jgi:hypothetical protein